MPDLEIESLKRSIDLTQYARSIGYQERPRDAVPGIIVLESATVLEQGRLGDRIAVARLASGGIYARIPDYAPRGEGESEELARRRLRDCITRSKDTGSIVEFVRSNERRVGRPEPNLTLVRDHLIAWRQASRELPRGAEPHPDPNVLNRRMGDWRPSPLPQVNPTLQQVEERIRRWQDAQRALDFKLWQDAQRATDLKLARSPQGPTLPGAGADGVNKALSPREISRGQGDALAPNTPQHALAQRRYDWTPPASPESAQALGRTLPGRGPDRGR